MHKEVSEPNAELIQETVLDTSNHVCESLDVSWVVLNAVCEQEGYLLGLDGLFGEKVSLGSFNTVGEALLEDELVVVTDCDGNHQRSVGWECLLLSKLNELSQEIVAWLAIITNNILDHNHSVVSVCLLVNWQEFRKIKEELSGVV
jgi:hypothetical protein